MKYTPGPWTVAELKMPEFRIQAHFQVVAWTGHDKRPSNLPYEERKANAHLMAESPNLLEVCHNLSLLLHNRGDHPDDETREMEKKWLKKAAKTMKKAQGGNV